MTPFERARHEALQARQTLLGAEAFRLVPSREIVAAIANKLGVDVVLVSPTSKALANADGVLRRIEKCIYVRNDLTPERTALFVAHELGHYYLDPAQASDKTTLDAEIALSSGTNGTVAVESYGARERLELAANVFAREFLLPNQVALDAFTGGKGPLQVAEHADLELDLVRQQMLDAVLLPSSTPPTTSAPPNLTDEQRVASQASERYVNVVAGPGAGKTSCLIARARHLMADRCIEPSRIMALTFTNKAAAALVERLRDVPGSYEMWAGTFHAFGLEFLRKFHQHFGLPPDLQVLDKFEAINILLDLVKRVPLRFYTRLEDPLDWLPQAYDGICRLKEEMRTPEDFTRWVSNQPESSDRDRQQDLAAIFTAYNNTIHQDGFVDFVDLVAMPARALAEDRVPFSEFIDRYEHILVDEYQDVTEAMVRLLQGVGYHKSVWVVGDIRQAIHHWRGASIRSLLKFREKMATSGQSAREYKLKFNHRSSQSIVEAIRVVGQKHLLQDQFPLVDMEALPNAKGPKPKIHKLVSKNPGPALANEVLLLNQQGISFGDQMVLARANSDLEVLANELAAAGIPVLYIGDLNRRAEVQQLLCLMSLLVHRYPTGLAGIATPELRVRSSDLAILLEATKTDGLQQRGGWLKRPLQALSDDGRAKIGSIAALLEGHTRNSNPWDFLCDLILEKRFGLPPIHDACLSNQIIRLALWQFAYAARATNSNGSFRTLGRFLLARRIRQRIGDGHAERELPTQAQTINAVRLLTVHGSKGLEAEAVHVAGLSKEDYGNAEPFRGVPDYFPLVPPEAFDYPVEDYKADAAIERNNLLFVALSRAKKYLHCYCRDDDRAHELAPYSDLCAASTVTSHAGTSGATATGTPSGDAVKNPFPYHDFNIYAGCPRRHHYKLTLGYPEQNPPDIAATARRAIEEAVRLLAIGERTSEAALRQCWEEMKLPNPSEDETLWNEANHVFLRAAERLTSTKGTLTTPKTTVSNTSVSLPWMLEIATKGELIWFTTRRLSKFLESRVRPLINAMTPSPRSLVLYSALDGAEMRPSPSGRITSTAVYGAARRNEAGETSPTPGYPCKMCGYALICPALPPI